MLTYLKRGMHSRKKVHSAEAFLYLVGEAVADGTRLNGLEILLLLVVLVQSNQVHAKMNIGDGTKDIAYTDFPKIMGAVR